MKLAVAALVFLAGFCAGWWRREDPLLKRGFLP